jgi:hypothetical protein
VIRVYDDAGNVIETHEHAGEKMGGIGFGYPARILTRRRLNYGQLPGGWLKPENRFRVPMKV